MSNHMTRREVVAAGAAVAAGAGGIKLGNATTAEIGNASEDRRQVAAPSLGFRLAGERGVANHGWLRSRHTFSFGSYYNAQWMGFRNLRVINDDRVDPSAGFPTHPHRDMEILSYVLEGALEHKDSVGTGSVIRPGDVQRMSAGTGVRHSEYNGSKDELVHFLQIWIEPAARGIKPGYEQKTFSDGAKRGKLALVASSDGRAGSVTVHADVALHAGVFKTGDRATHDLASGRHAWLHVAKGSVKVGGKRLEAGDAAFTTNNHGERLVIEGDGTGEVLLFDLP
jgi:redox-sensitive bicupin YhaK (pirin superfamily)